MTKTIDIRLSEGSLNRAIKELRAYALRIEKREEELREKLAKIGMDVAKVTLTGATYDGTNDVKVRTDDDGSSVTIYAEGKAVAFIEFGAGAKYGYGHPMADELGVGPGTYPDGKGHWDDPNGWYYAHGKKSHGNPPAKGMLAARDAVVENITRIAREVFST